MILMRVFNPRAVGLLHVDPLYIGVGIFLLGFLVLLKRII